MPQGLLGEPFAVSDVELADRLLHKRNRSQVDAQVPVTKAKQQRNVGRIARELSA